MGSVLTVWGLALELNLERSVLQKKSLPLPQPGPLIQARLWTGAPSTILGSIA